MVNRRHLLSLAAASVGTMLASRSGSSQTMPTSTSPTSQAIFPGSQWEAARPEDLHWSIEGLADAYRLFASLPPASLVVVDGGRVVVAWGDSARRIKVSSIRKSLLSALYGRPVLEGRIALDDTLEVLGIDDDPPLTQGEKQATLRMLLQARSGIYHSYVGGTPYMRERMPARGSHLPGGLWSYNNWDFNALGGIYERKLGQKIGTAFEAEIASPIQMQDFRLEDMYYLNATNTSEEYAKSLFLSLSLPSYGERHGEIRVLDAAAWRLERRCRHSASVGGPEHDILLGHHRIRRSIRIRLSVVDQRLRST